MEDNKYFVGFDLETTGLDKNKDHIIQFCGIKLKKDTMEVVKTFNQYIKPIGNYTISVGAYLKNKITPELLNDKPTLPEVADKIVDLFKDADVITYNGNKFDIPFLLHKLQPLGYYIDFLNKKCYDSYKIESRITNNQLSTVYERYTGKHIDETKMQFHNALYDTMAMIEIFKYQRNNENFRFEEMVDEDGLFEMMNFQGEIKPCFTFGKYRDISIDFVAEFDKSYLNWLIGFNNLLPKTKEFIKQYIK